MAPYTRFPPKDRRGGSLSAPGPALPDPLPAEPAPGPVSGPGPVRAEAALSGAGALPARGLQAETARGVHPVVLLLLFSLIIPIVFSLGSMRLSPNRVVILLAFLPAIFVVLSGAAGRIRAADLWMLACSAWIALSILANHGMAQIQFAGITVIEILGAYMIGRAFVRTERQYRGLVRVLWVLMVILLPAAAIESVTTIQIYTRIFEPAFQTFPWSGYEKRLGLWRAQTVFEHAILYGTFCAFTMAPIWHAARNEGGRIRAWFLALPSLLTTFFCLSLGAWLGVIVQLGLMTWGWVLRSFTWRWSLLGWLAVAAYVTVDLLSNRTPFEVFISYLAFDAHTAYWRVLIFTYGMENVWAHPVFGLGLTDWARPYWMTTGTVDNLWLVFAMRYGIPGFFFLIAAYVSVVLALTRARPAAATARVHRDGLAFSFIGLAICIATVHLWNASFVFMVFMMGAASWVADAPRDASAPGSAPGPRGVAAPAPAADPRPAGGLRPVPPKAPLRPSPARTAGPGAAGSRASDRRVSAPARRPAGRA